MFIFKISSTVKVFQGLLISDFPFGYLSTDVCRTLFDEEVYRFVDATNSFVSKCVAGNIRSCICLKSGTENR